MSQLLDQHNKLIDNLKRRDDIIQKKFNTLDDRLGLSSSVDCFSDQLKKAIARHRHQINTNLSDFEMLVAEHESLVTQVKKLADPSFRSVDKDDRLSDLSYGAPPRTSSGLSFHGGASPIPIPIPAPACQGHSTHDAPSELKTRKSS